MTLVCRFQQSLGSSPRFLATTFAYQLLEQAQVSRRSIAGLPFITYILRSLAQYRDRQRSATLCQRLVNGTSSRSICILQPSNEYRFGRSHLLQTGRMCQCGFRSRLLLHEVQQHVFGTLYGSQATDSPFRQIVIVQIFYKGRSIFRFATHAQQRKQESLVRIVRTSLQGLYQTFTDCSLFRFLSRCRNVCHYPIQGIFHDRVLSFTGRDQHICHLCNTFGTSRSQFAHHFIEHLLFGGRKLVQCIGNNRFRCTHTGILCRHAPRQPCRQSQYDK